MEKYADIIYNTFLLPIIVAIVTYFLVDRLGEYRKRKNYSRLGIAIIEYLLEEIDTGIKVMTDALNASEDKLAKGPPPFSLPNRSWNGMSTIPDEVLLRILETSANRSFKPFQPRDCRTHCKNYFGNICENYKGMIEQIYHPSYKGQDWRTLIKTMLIDDSSGYLGATRGVAQMLRDTKQLLEENTKKLFPK